MSFPLPCRSPLLPSDSEIECPLRAHWRFLCTMIDAATHCLRHLHFDPVLNHSILHHLAIAATTIPIPSLAAIPAPIRHFHLHLVLHLLRLLSCMPLHSWQRLQQMDCCFDFAEVLDILHLHPPPLQGPARMGLKGLMVLVPAFAGSTDFGYSPDSCPSPVQIRSSRLAGFL